MRSIPSAARGALQHDLRVRRVRCVHRVRRVKRFSLVTAGSPVLTDGLFMTCIFSNGARRCTVPVVVPGDGRAAPSTGKICGSLEGPVKGLP